MGCNGAPMVMDSFRSDEYDTETETCTLTYVEVTVFKSDEGEILS